jgi:endonuclease/exonuclease/phosphatase (EEP) superfamily protein YafD
VLSLNLLRGNHDRLAAALQVVRDEAADVVFCAEVTPEWLAGLAAGLPEFPHRCLRADEGYFGVALFSRWPLQQAEVVPLGVSWAPAIRAIVATPAGPLGVLGVHTPRPGNAERCRQCDAALAAVPAALASLPAAHVVLGDCNATPWNHGFRAMRAATGLASATDGGWHPTWTAAWPLPLRIPIDHILISPAVGARDATVGPSFGSDHLPLAATLLLQQR